jgi:hypothetical protein
MNRSLESGKASKRHGARFFTILTVLQVYSSRPVVDAAKDPSKNLRNRRYKLKFWRSMSKLLKNLLSLWMVWAIALLPLQAFSALPVPANSEPCPMHTTAAEHQHGGQHAGHRDASQTPCSTCQSCDQHDCDGDDCAAGSCSGMHLQPAMLSTRLAELYPAAGNGDGLPWSGMASRTDPPPLPPPV